MPRCMYHFQCYFSNGENLPVLCKVKLKISFGARSINNRCACLFAKVKMAAYKIGVKVSLDDVLDGEPIFRGLIDIERDVALRIDHAGHAIRAQHIRGMGQASEVKLLEVHNLSRQVFAQRTVKRTDEIGSLPGRGLFVVIGDRNHYAHQRKVVERRGLLVPVTPLTPARDDEEIVNRTVRFRTVGDITCTCPVPSHAANASQVVIETLTVEVSERGATRMDDKTSDASMEKRKKDGYF